MRFYFLTLSLLWSINISAQWLELNSPGTNQLNSNLPVTEGGTGFTIGNTVHNGTGVIQMSSANDIYNSDFYKYDLNTGMWKYDSLISGFCLPRSGATSFTHNGMAYVGFGKDELVSYNDFFKIDIQTGVITQLTNLPTQLHRAISFVSGSKAYVGGGYNMNVPQMDMYSYDFSSNSWQMENPLPAFILNTGNTFVMEIDNQGYMLAFRDTLLNYVRTWSKYDTLTHSWIPRSPYPGNCVQYVSGFSMGDQGFVGFGYDTSFNNLSEFFQYDALNDNWIQKNSYDKVKVYAKGFSNGVKSGIYSSNGSLSEYDVVTDSWQVKINPLMIVPGAKMIVINNKAYGYMVTYNISNDTWTKDTAMNMFWTFELNGFGYGFSNGIFSWFDPSLPIIPFLPANPPPAGVNTFFKIGNKGYAGDFYNDSTHGFWEFNPVSGGWTRKADFPGPKRESGGGFSIGNKGYITGGWCNDIGWYIYDFWEYDPQADTWSQKADGPTGYLGSFMEGDATRGYMGCGLSDAVGSDNGNVSVYDPATNTWSPLAGLSARHGVYSFIAFDHLYVGGGFTRYSQQDAIAHYDFYKLPLAGINAVNELADNKSLEIYPNPSNGIIHLGNDYFGSITIFDIDGKKVASEKINHEAVIDLRNKLKPGVYFISTDSHPVLNKKIIILPE